MLRSNVKLGSKANLRMVQKERSFLEFGTLSLTTEVSVRNEGLRESVSQVIVGVVASSEIKATEVMNAEVLDTEVMDTDVLDSEVVDSEIEIVGVLGVPVVEPVVVGGEGYSVLKVLVGVESPEVVLPWLR
jgi:hypothetical protein